MSKDLKKGLGKGLGALLQAKDVENVTLAGRQVGGIVNISISQIEANPFQPRQEFDKTALEELSNSIKVHGVIQPITVRKVNVDRYQIISGERRTKASVLAGKTTIPAYIRIANDQEMLEMALIENIQRQDLNAIEVAFSYQRLVDECNLKMEELAERVGKQRSTVNNYLRLLKLPIELQSGIKEGKISMGHARAIINIDDKEEQLAIFRSIIDDSLSVRDVEEKAREIKDRPEKGGAARNMTANRSSAETQYLEFKGRVQEVAEKFGTTITLKPKPNGKGQMVINFDSEEELRRILEFI